MYFLLQVLKVLPLDWQTKQAYSFPVFCPRNIVKVAKSKDATQTVFIYVCRSCEETYVLLY